MEETSKEAQISILAPSMFPGFKFSPTDEELISYYLKKKLEGSDSCVQLISEVEICKHEPWDLPAKSVIKSDNEWFFFSPRGKKYPNGSQSKRATAAGYWKATGRERNVKSGATLIGTKRTLVFHTGRAPKGERTEWRIHEYCMNGKNQDSLVVCRLRNNSEFCSNDTSRRGFENQRNLASGNDRIITSSEIGIEQASVIEGANAVDCCSKDCSSSYNSHSVGQIDSGSESNEKVTNEFSQHSSSSHQKDSDYEDDCFADIMKDDIIDLGKSLLKASDLVPRVSTESKADRKAKQPVQEIVSPALPFQGTANRRLRLKKRKAKHYRTEPLEAFDVGHGNYSSEGIIHSYSQQSAKYLINILSNRAVSHWFITVFLVILTLLVLLLSLLGGSWLVKRFTYAAFF